MMLSDFVDDGLGAGWPSGPDVASELSGHDPFLFGDDTSHSVWSGLELGQADEALESMAPDPSPVQMPANLTVSGTGGNGTVDPKELTASEPNSLELGFFGLGISPGTHHPFQSLPAALDTPHPADAQPWNREVGPTASFREPLDSDPSSSDTGHPGRYRCDFPGCQSKRTFRLPSQLRKHQNNHLRRWKCPHCTEYKGGAERKDLARHVRKCHRDLAEVLGDKSLWKEEVLCPGCHKKMRSDNRKRHMRTCPAVRKSEGSDETIPPVSPSSSGRRRRSS
ncbi:hypothetical protein VTJ49DRAFT_2747 [Mycothermus thermophilus]|uniref:C2H2-type domain-containing protein n=1 Tax=Humicola insolens TaxID=85995 RepID=A0ABR3VQH5_HUMIN